VSAASGRRAPDGRHDLVGEAGLRPLDVRRLGVPGRTDDGELVAWGPPASRGAPAIAGTSRPRRGDLQQRGRLLFDLQRRVIDAEARVEDDVQLVEDPVGRRVRRDDDVGAHGLAT